MLSGASVWQERAYEDPFFFALHQGQADLVPRSDARHCHRTIFLSVYIKTRLPCRHMGTHAVESVCRVCHHSAAGEPLARNTYICQFPGWYRRCGCDMLASRQEDNEREETAHRTPLSAAYCLRSKRVLLPTRGKKKPAC
jgi:hypothetical protein